VVRSSIGMLSIFLLGTILDDLPRSSFSMISSSYSTVLPLFIGLKLIGEFTSLEEPTEVSDLPRKQFFMPTNANL
jgi:hypothetical protein